jgi:hypothetical protein
MGARSRRPRSASEFSAEPCESESRFVAGRQGREELIDAIRGEIGKDRGRSVAPDRRRGVPVAAVRLLRRSICCSVYAVRALGRMPVASARAAILPANVCSTPAACVRGAELDGASRSSANAFRRGNRICFGSFHSSYPAFLLASRVLIARVWRRILKTASGETNVF